MTVTYIELDILRRDMLIAANDRYSVSRDRLQQLIDFTTKLHTLLVSEVVDARFSYRPYLGNHMQFIWGRSLYGGGIPRANIAISVEDTSIYLRVDAVTHKVEHIQEMVAILREYVESTRMEMEAHNHCSTCYYSDEEVQHCGMGRPLSLDCIDYTPMEVV